MNAMKLTRIPNPSPASGDISPEDDLWDVGRAARFLGLSRSWVYRTAEAGLLPYRRIASRLRFVPAELRAWAHAQTGGAR